MRRGGRLLVLLGLVLGVMTGGVIFITLSQAQPSAPPAPTSQIVIAFQNIPARTVITADVLGKQDLPATTLPPGSFTDAKEVIGKLTLVPIFQGQVILPQMIVDKLKITSETRSNASFLIPEGKVAMAYPLTDISSVANALQAGDTIDILLTLNPQLLATSTRTTTTPATTTTAGTEGQAVTQLMLQDVLVLQVGNWSSAPTAAGQEKAAPPSAIVTFVLDRQDALVLKSAREQGTLELVLRRAGEHKPFTTEPVNLQYLNRRFNFNLTPGIAR